MTATNQGTSASLLGGFAQDFDVTFAEAGFYFTNSGLSYRLEGGGSSLINSATDWIFPRTSFTAADWQIRGTYTAYISTGAGVTEVGTAFVPTPVGTVGSWYGLGASQTFEWRAQTTFFGPIRGLEASIRFEIRNSIETNYNTETSVEDAAAIAASGIYSVSVEAFTLN
jgi:hypothetical protein